MTFDKPNEDRNCLGALDMPIELSSSLHIHKDCDNESPTYDEAKSSIVAKIVKSGNPKAMGNGINISMFVRTQVESDHCESYETSSLNMKEAFSHLIGLDRSMDSDKYLERQSMQQERITKKRTKNKAKTTKPGTEWKSCEGQSQIKAKDQKSQSQSQLNKLTVKTGAVIEEYYWLQSQPI
ncbi:hypothetical protein Tco_0811615 [Tanacetum coccineum]